MWDDLGRVIPPHILSSLLPPPRRPHFLKSLLLPPSPFSRRRPSIPPPSLAHWGRRKKRCEKELFWWNGGIGRSALAAKYPSDFGWVWQFSTLEGRAEGPLNGHNVCLPSAAAAAAAARQSQADSRSSSSSSSSSRPSSLSLPGPGEERGCRPTLREGPLSMSGQGFPKKSSKLA